MLLCAIITVYNGEITHMKKNRIQAIVNFVNNHHYASFAELREEFGVSNATMRRDLTTLDELGLIRRVHGGAKSLTMAEVHDTSMQIRKSQNVAEKEALSKYALSLIKQGDSIIIDASTTLLPLARMIAASNLHITVITNYLEVAEALADCERIDLYFLGGIMKSHYYSCLGPFAEKMLKAIEVDKYFISADSITPEAGLRNTHYDTIPLKQIGLANSKKHYAFLDHTKFNSSSFLPVCSLDEIDVLVTNKELPDEIYNEYLNKGVNIVRV